MGFAVDAFKVGELAGFADQHPQLSTLGGKCFGHMMAYESCCAGEKDFHQ
jgi:hypothetical protein